MLRTSVIDNDIKEYIGDCKVKAEYHKKMATNANGWYNFLGIVGVLLSSVQALVITVLAVYKVGENEVAIASGSFALLTAVFARVQSAYSFNLLSLQHHNAFDDYIELIRDFSLLDNESFDENIYKLHVHRHTSVIEKSHHQPVRNCFMLTLFC